MTSGVYQIKNKVNGRVYVGSAINTHTRWREHKRALNQGRHYNKHLQRAWDKYGIGSFVFEILESIGPEGLIRQEQVWMDLLDVVQSGYNMCPTAGSCLGRRLSEETKRKISEAHMGMKGSPAWNKGLKMPEEYRRKLSEAHKGQVSPMKGKHHTDEAKQKLSKALKGRTAWNKGSVGIYTEETRRRISASVKALWATDAHREKMSTVHKDRVSPMKGKHHTEETKRKLSEALKGRKHSLESRMKMSVAVRRSLQGRIPSMKGRKHSEETKAKMSEAHKGKVKTLEHQRKINEALTGRVISKEAKQNMREGQRRRRLREAGLKANLLLDTVSGEVQ